MQSTPTLSVRDLVRTVETDKRPSVKGDQRNNPQALGAGDDVDTSMDKTAKRSRIYAWQVPPGELNRAMRNHPKPLTEEQILAMRCLYHTFFRYGSIDGAARDAWDERLGVELERMVLLLYDVKDEKSGQQAKDNGGITGKETKET